MFMIQIFSVPAGVPSHVPSRFIAEENRILVPSGENTGRWLSSAATVFVFLVSAVRPVPSAFMIQMFIGVLVPSGKPLSAVIEENAILLPSGEKTGVKLLKPVAVLPVSGIGLLPSAPMTQIFADPVGVPSQLPLSAVFEVKTSLVQSGEKFGDRLCSELAVFLVSGVMPVPSEFISQML